MSTHTDHTRHHARHFQFVIALAVSLITCAGAFGDEAYSVRHTFPGDPDPNDDSLYRIDLDTGVATLIGPLNNTSGTGLANSRE